MSITEIVVDCLQIGAGALVIIITTFLVYSGETNVFFYLALIAKIKLQECQPQVQQFW